MKSALFAISVASLMTAGVAAQTPGDDYVAAQKIFGAAPGAVLDGVDGKWLPIAQLLGGIETVADAGMVGTMMDRFCATAPLYHEITARGTAGLTLVTHKTGDSLSESYDWLAGSQFAYTVEPDAFMSFLGMEDASDERRSLALAERPERVALFRSAPDILVMVPDRGATSILARCS